MEFIAQKEMVTEEKGPGEKGLMQHANHLLLSHHTQCQSRGAGFKWIAAHKGDGGQRILIAGPFYSVAIFF